MVKMKTERELPRASLLLGLSDRDRNDADDIHQDCRSGWYFSKEVIERNSPSRKDGVDSKKEAQLRASYCSFLQDVGMRLRIPQITIGTAMMMCHRFYLHQSHAKNEWQTVATVCMFLASKAEDTPCSLDKVVVVAYEAMYRNNPDVAQRIHRKEVFEKQKALILIGERLVLCTIRYDFNIHHPYKPLHVACKKLGITRKDVVQVAWNFVNDCLRTTLCLQYKPHYIASGSLYLACKLHNVKLPSGNGYAWWHEFEVMPNQLKVVINQMVELCGQYKRPENSEHAQTPLVIKDSLSSSPDSVLNPPGSSSCISIHDTKGKVHQSANADTKTHSEPRDSDTKTHPSTSYARTHCEPRNSDTEAHPPATEDPKVQCESRDSDVAANESKIADTEAHCEPIDSGTQDHQPATEDTEVQCEPRDSDNESKIADTKARCEPIDSGAEARQPANKDIKVQCEPKDFDTEANQPATADTKAHLEPRESDMKAHQLTNADIETHCEPKDSDTASNRLPKMNLARIKALREKQKRAGDGKRKRALDEPSEDSWIVKELECGVESASKFSKKQKSE